MKDDIIRLSEYQKSESAAAPFTSGGEQAPAFSEEALALRFAEDHADDLRYVARWSRWLVWDSKRWAADEKLSAFALARKLCRTAASECNRKKIAMTLASAKTVAAIERLAKADPRLAASVDDWDADPWSFNAPGGTIDLRTGGIRKHDPADPITKIGGATPTASQATPMWSAFLTRVTGNQTELAAYLQRMAGYVLTGSTKEHALFFFYGSGANGKTTFVRAITDCAGDYHRGAPIETFTASPTDQHPTDLAGLCGARLVTAVETEEGRRWAESKIKALTGGDKISARFMRQDFFEYTPQFKLIIAGNHKPGLRSVDEAIRRRFNLIPFTVTIPPDERDPDLPEKLKTEYAGIMAWMIKGCLEWQRLGLAPPEIVTAATAAYLESEDALAAWMDEAGQRDPQAFETTTRLFASWKVWAEKAGEYVGARKQFIARMSSKGLVEARPKASEGRGFRGLRLSPTFYEDRYAD